MKSKKLLTSAIALGTAAALTLGGTFAWQSISQKATNEASDIVNPGGRLHNDQHWVSALENDTNIYVENFIEAGKGDDIYARVRLSEYMEVVMNYGTAAEVVDVVAGSKTLKADVTDEGLTNDSATQKDKFDYEYAIHDFTKDFDDDDETTNPTSDFFTWTEGKADADRPYFIPTFNKNKDSVAADLNGEYVDTLGGISNRKADQYTYTEITADTEDVEGWAIYDTDSDKLDELQSLTYAELKAVYEEGEASTNDTVQNALTNKDIQLVEETHSATQVGTTKGLISMSDWLELAETEGYKNTDGSLTEDGKTALYGYWVYDTDGSGWVYWSAPIAAGETTGLLLDGFKLNGVMDDTWYYAIDVEAQFVTANDVGSVEDNDGFYTVIDTASVIDLEDTDSDETGTTPKAVSDDAETLLKLIGVEFGEDTIPELHIYDYQTRMYNTVSVTDTSKNQFILCKGDTDEHPGADSFKIQYAGDGSSYLTQDADYTYDPDTGLLTILLADDDPRLNSFGTELTVHIEDVDDSFDGYLKLIWNDDGELTLTAKRNDATITRLGQAVKVQDADGPLTSIRVEAFIGGMQYEIEAEDNYTYDESTGMLTITSDRYKQSDFMQVYKNGVYNEYATIYLTATDGNTSDGGGQTETDTTLEVTIDGSNYNATWLTSTDDNGNTVFTCENDPENANGDLSATVGEGCTVSYEIIASSLTENGWEIKEMDEDGNQYIMDTSGAQDLSAMKFMLTSSGTFMMKESVTDDGGDCTIKVTSTKDGAVVATKTIVLKWGNSTTEE